MHRQLWFRTVTAAKQPLGLPWWGPGAADEKIKAVYRFLLCLKIDSARTKGRYANAC